LRDWAGRSTPTADSPCTTRKKDRRRLLPKSPPVCLTAAVDRKPSSVPIAGIRRLPVRPFLWDARRRAPQATYPRMLSPRAGTLRLFGLAAGGVCHATGVTSRAVRSYRTISPLPRGCPRGGLFSVALSVGLPRLDVIKHRALCSSDFPRPASRLAARLRARPPHRPQPYLPLYPLPPRAVRPGRRRKR